MSYDFEQPIHQIDIEGFYKSLSEDVDRAINQTKSLRSHVSMEWLRNNNSRLPQLAYERMLALRNHLNVLKAEDSDLHQKYKDDFYRAYQKIENEISYLENGFANQVDTTHRFFSDVDSFSKAPQVNPKPRVKGGKGAEMVSDSKKLRGAYLEDVHTEAKKYVDDNPNDYLTKSNNPTKDFYSSVHRRLDIAQFKGEDVRIPSKSWVKNRLKEWIEEKS